MRDRDEQDPPTKATELSDLSEPAEEHVRGGASVDPCWRKRTTSMEPCWRPATIVPCVNPGQ